MHHCDDNQSALEIMTANKERTVDICDDSKLLGASPNHDSLPLVDFNAYTCDRDLYPMDSVTEAVDVADYSPDRDSPSLVDANAHNPDHDSLRPIDVRAHNRDRDFDLYPMDSVTEAVDVADYNPDRDSPSLVDANVHNPNHDSLPPIDVRAHNRDRDLHLLVTEAIDVNAHNCDPLKGNRTDSRESSVVLSPSLNKTESKPNQHLSKAIVAESLLQESLSTSTAGDCSSQPYSPSFSNFSRASSPLSSLPDDDQEVSHIVSHIESGISSNEVCDNSSSSKDDSLVICNRVGLDSEPQADEQVPSLACWEVMTSAAFKKSLEAIHPKGKACSRYPISSVMLSHLISWSSICKEFKTLQGCNVTFRRLAIQNNLHASYGAVSPALRSPSFLLDLDASFVGIAELSNSISRDPLNPSLNASLSQLSTICQLMRTCSIRLPALEQHAQITERFHRVRTTQLYLHFYRWLTEFGPNLAGYL